MPTYVVTIKPDASDADVQAVKEHTKEQGGTIDHEYSLIKGFVASFPHDNVQTLSEHPHVEHIEADSEVKTQ